MTNLTDLISSSQLQMLYIIRGIPGSGKSTLAKKMLDAGEIDAYYEADMFFYDSSGNYKFDRSKLNSAHLWCKNKTFAALSKGKSVAVSNTFIKKWEFQEYINFAIKNSIPFKVIVSTGNWNNIHGVPPEVISRMKSQFEDK